MEQGLGGLLFLLAKLVRKTKWKPPGKNTVREEEKEAKFILFVREPREVGVEKQGEGVSLLICSFPFIFFLLCESDINSYSFIESLL